MWYLAEIRWDVIDDFGNTVVCIEGFWEAYWGNH